MKRLSAKTIAARERSAKLMLPAGKDNGAKRYYTGGAQVTPRDEHTATGPVVNLMQQPVYVPGEGEHAVRRVMLGKVADCVCAAVGIAPVALGSLKSLALVRQIK